MRGKTLFTDLILEDRHRTDLEVIETQGKRTLYKFTLCGHTAEFAKATKVELGVRCVGCYEDKVAAAARNSGMTLVHQECIDNNRIRAFKFDACGHIRVAQVHDILKPRNGKFQCVDCQIQINKQEAEDAGMQLLRSADKSFGKGYANYKLYKFNECGHEQFCQPTHVRRKNIKCNTCFEQEIRNHLESVNYELVGHVKGSVYRTRAKECLHEFDMYLGSIRNRTTDRCPICYEERISNECIPRGLELVGKSDTHIGQYRKYRFISCGHTIDTAPEAIRDDRFECKTCVNTEFLSLIEPQGLRVLPKQSVRGYRWFTLPCGCEKEIRMEHARNGTWLCGHCGDSYYTKESNLYLVKYTSDEFSWLKFGYARNLDLRFNSYGIPSHYKRELLFSIPMETGYSALETEKSIHFEFKKYRLDKELMKQYHTSNGYTECYPVGIEEMFISKLNGLLIEK